MLQGYEDGRERPYIHLVDGGLAGNLGVYPIVEALQEAEASEGFRQAVGVERLRRIVVVIVNAYAAPNEMEQARGRPFRPRAAPAGSQRTHRPILV
jgi:hypothetical protein